MTTYVVHWDVLMAAACIIAFGGIILGCIVGFVAGSVCSTSNRDGAWDAHETQAKHVARNINPPVN